MTVFVQKPAPDFHAEGVRGLEFVDVKLSDFRAGGKLGGKDGKHVVLFFYPLDFTFVCPTEIIAFDDKLEEYKKRGAEVIGCSVDSKYTHLAWQKTPRNQGGLGNVKYTLVADITKSISRDYGVLVDDGGDAGLALRGTFVIDRKGNVRHVNINDMPLGRNIEEPLRVIDAIEFNDKHGEVCPANWAPGKDSMKADPEGLKAYFSKQK